MPPPPPIIAVPSKSPPAMSSHHTFMREAIDLSMKVLLTKQGGPFGAVIVRNGQVVGRGSNMVTVCNDPTAHAEVVAIRDACATLNTFQLNDCELYTSCEPCPMCLAAVYWARIPVLYFGNSRKDAASIGFDDDFLYEQVALVPENRTLRMIPLLREEALVVFQGWVDTPDKVEY